MTIVCDRDADKFFLIQLFSDVLNMNLYHPLAIGKFEGVGNYVQKDLLKSLFISLDEMVAVSNKVEILRKLSEYWSDFNLFHLCFVLHYFNDLLNRISHIEDWAVLCEFIASSVDDRVV